MTEKDKIPGTGNAGDPSKFAAAPEGYFESLESRVMQRINAAQQLPAKRRLLPLKIWLPLTAAAILLISFFIFRSPKEQQPVMTLQSELAGIPDEEIIAVLMTESVDEEALTDDINTTELLSDSSDYLQSEILEQELGSDPNLELLIDEL